MALPSYIQSLINNNSASKKAALKAATVAVPTVGIPLTVLNNMLQTKSTPSPVLNMPGFKNNPANTYYTNPQDIPKEVATAPTTTPVATTTRTQVEQPVVAPISDTGYMSMTNQTTPTANVAGNPYADLVALQNQQAQDFINRRGLYSSTGGAMSPDLMRSIEGSADDVYGERIAQKAVEADRYGKMMTSGYGINSALAGLPSNAVNLVYKFSDDFHSSPIVKNFNTVQSSALKANNIVQNILNRPNQEANAGDDMALMYLFAKAQDPESVVRESEYDNVAQYFSNLPQNIQFSLSRYYQETPDGRLTPNSRKAMIEGLNTLYNSQKEQYDNLKRDTTNRINGIAGREVSDLFLNTYEDAYSPESNLQSLIQQAKNNNYSDEEIQEYLKSKGLSFSQVGNTTASINIPPTSRLSYVNNNPGNLRYAGQEGAVKGESGFARFQSPWQGLQALSNQVALDTNRGHTLESFINKFAPPTENNTKQYINQAVAKLGVSPNTPLSKIPHDELVKFIALKESSTKIS
ncbi:hypothetical protein EKK58_06175 [Candidatus Dependentiae bacterium]|nr:MAG: hypothetical protein EKK58_06175 [Candidatus Dependentiae bacterium]